MKFATKRGRHVAEEPIKQEKARLFSCLSLCEKLTKQNTNRSVANHCRLLLLLTALPSLEVRTNIVHPRSSGLIDLLVRPDTASRRPRLLAGTPCWWFPPLNRIGSASIRAGSACCRNKPICLLTGSFFVWSKSGIGSTCRLFRLHLVAARYGCLLTN